jgi:hypothetical protein
LKVSCVLCSFSFSSSFPFLLFVLYIGMGLLGNIISWHPILKRRKEKKCSPNCLMLGIWTKSRYWRMDLPVTKGSVHDGLCREESFVQHHFSLLKSPADAKNKMNQTWQKSRQCKN